MKIAKIIFGIFSFVFAAGFAVADFEEKRAAPPPIFCPSFLPGCGEQSSDYHEHSFFRVIVPNILNWLMALGAAGGVLMGVISGTMYLFGGANEELRGRAHKTGMFAVIGILLSMFAFFIVEIINRLPYPGS